MVITPEVLLYLIDKAPFPRMFTVGLVISYGAYQLLPREIRKRSIF